MPGDPHGPVIFRAFAEDRPGDGWRAHVRRHWTSPPRPVDPTTAAWRAAVLDLSAPMLARMWAELVDAADCADPALAAYLTHVDPPPSALRGGLATAGRTLVRNLDFAVDRHEATLWRSGLGARRVLGMTAGLWGLHDGMNEDGLAVALTAGGDQGHGGGLGGPILVRYLLERCATVAEVDAALPGWRSASAHDLTVLDASGARAAYRLSPGSPTRRGRTQHWDDPDEALSAMLGPPRFRADHPLGAGTLYTAAYRPAEGSVTLHWQDREWTRSFDHFEPAEVAVRYTVGRPW